VNQVALALALVASSTACSKASPASEEAGALEAQPGGATPVCPALAVTIDGKPFTSFGSKYAFTKQGKRISALIVRWAEGPGVTCDQVVDPAFDVAATETYITAGLGNVGFGQTLQPVELVQIGGDPTKVGDPVGVCIPETIFRPTSGPHAGKMVVVSGALVSPWCGAQPTSRP